MPYGIGTIAMIGGGAIAAAGFVPIALGFGTLGIVAGSVAAATQSSFATMTSLGMNGVFSTLAGVGTAITGAGAAIAALIP